MTEDEYAEIAALIDDGRNTKQIMCRLGCSEALVLEVRAERTRRGACERTARYKAEGRLPGYLPEWDDGRFLAALVQHMPPAGDVFAPLGRPVSIGRDLAA